MFLFIGTPRYFLQTKKEKLFFEKKKSFVFSKKKITEEGFFFPEIFFQEKNFSTKTFFFTEHLIFRNSYMNLISNFSAKVLYKNHFFDSLTPAVIFFCFWPRNKPLNCLDVGSGGGFPGLVLSLFFPGFFFCLLDSVQRKTSFHKLFLCSFQISNSRSLCQRAEIMTKFSKHKEFYDFTLSRAVAELNLLLTLCLPLTRKQGKLVFMKKISTINQEFKLSFELFESSGAKIKCLIHIHKLGQGKFILIINKGNV